MEVKTAPFYIAFRRTIISISLSLQLAVVIFGSGWWWLLSIINPPFSDILALAIGLIILEGMALSISLALALKPTKYLSQIITQTAAQNSEQQTNKKQTLQALIETLRTLKVPVHRINQAAASPDLLYKHIFSQLPFGIVVVDANKKIIQRNDHAPLRENAQDLRGLRLLFPPQDTLEDWLYTCENHEIIAERIWQRISTTDEGEQRRFYDVLVSYHKNGAGGAEVVITTIDRSTEYGPDEEHMEFIALAAHELRGPITVIRGYLDVFSDELAPLLSPDQKALMDRLSVSAHRLSGYVNNILGAARYDRRHLKLHLYEQSPVAIFDAVKDDLELRASTQNRLLSVNFPNDLPTVAADKTSIGEVLVNLVDNAIKYSSEGGHIIVSAGVTGNFVEYTVQDFGIGIPSSIIENLFTKFYRSHRSRETAAGSGLGLYISKAIVESHGGHIGVRSTEGHGSTFTFTLPVYATVAHLLKANNDSNDSIIESSNGWIRNHAMYRG